jgi:HAD superfamily hydrolase (TIGR01509 family)
MFDALIFDFDGLILDTETPQFRAWSEVYVEHGVELPVEVWVDCLGRVHAYFDFYADLEQRSGRAIDRHAVRSRRKQRLTMLIEAEQARPGIERCIDEARGRGLKLAVASSSDRPWVEGNLRRLGLYESFQCLVTMEDTSVHKPDPAPFLMAADRLGVDPARCIALEDSPNGIASACAAGMAVVAIPNELTRRLDLAAAHLVVDSLADLSLDELMGQLKDRLGGGR